MIAARLLQFAAVLLLFGSASFLLYAGPPTRPRTRADGHASAPGTAWLRWVWPLAALTGMTATLAWLSAEAASLTGSWTALADVVTGTHFGAVAVLRTLLLAVALAASLALQPGRGSALLVGLASGAAVASFVWTGHGAAGIGVTGLIHTAADALHLLAAAAWIGALVQLAFLAVRARHMDRAEQPSAQALARGLLRFSGLGPAVVVVLMTTGVINAWVLVGPPTRQAILGTQYGLTLLVKLLLFAGMLAFAAWNRLRLTPRLEAALDCAADCGPALRQLRASLIAETLLALLVLATVAGLGTLEPPAAGS
jgi:copper resistance protein D